MAIDDLLDAVANQLGQLCEEEGGGGRAERREKERAEREVQSFLAPPLRSEEIKHIFKVKRATFDVEKFKS